jgi:predicted deacylase
MATTASRPWEEAEPGKIWRGWWQIGAAGVPAVPVLAARGARDGPTLVVTGGVHGDEYEGPAAVHALFAGLEPARLRGRVLGVPVANMAAWQARARVTPADGGNLNRVFPGDRGMEGPTRALAEAIFEGLVRLADALVDLHSGGAALVHLPLIGWYAGDDGRAERLARGFGAALHPWLIPDARGVLSYEAQRAGKVALGAEWHGGARLDPDGAAAYTAGLRSVLRGLEMIDGEASEVQHVDARRPIAGDYQETPVGGLFVPSVLLAERVAAGQALGTLYDEVGVVVAEVPSAREGIVAGLPHLALLHAGDRVAYVG